ncbi:MAG: hypothetical protein HZB38_03715 [Planctomycetes bacterium]|nr:hypothetical protein [Planctomycetota bacterium]
MDRGQTVTDGQANPPAETPPSAPRTVQVEQAVFTSVPSPMGRGYRLVAASAGVTADEKREITQRAPSHGNLLDASEHGNGLYSFELRGGRRCVLATWHAETEHTGRGGRRVHTQAAILDRESFAQFSSNPILVEDAVRRTVDRMLIPKADSRLPLLELPLPDACAPDAASAAPYAADAALIDAVIAMTALLVTERRLIVTDAPDGRAAFQRVIELLPIERRAALDVALGMRFAPSRAASVVFTQCRREEMERIVRDHAYEAFTWSEPPELNISDELSSWFGLVHRTWRVEGLAALHALLAKVGPELSIEALTQIGRLMIDIGRIETVPSDRLDDVLERHLPFVRRNELQTSLHLKLMQAAETRRRHCTSLIPDIAITLP